MWVAKHDHGFACADSCPPGSELTLTVTLRVSPSLFTSQLKGGHSWLESLVASHLRSHEPSGGVLGNAEAGTRVHVAAAPWALAKLILGPTKVLRSGVTSTGALPTVVIRPAVEKRQILFLRNKFNH